MNYLKIRRYLGVTPFTPDDPDAGSKHYRKRLVLRYGIKRLRKLIHSIREQCRLPTISEWYNSCGESTTDRWFDTGYKVVEATNGSTNSPFTRHKYIQKS